MGEATSQARVEANRKNAQRSTGPRTDEGKARSRANAIKHGLRAETEIPVGERETYEHRLATWGQETRARGEVGAFLVQKAVMASLRLERCAAAETSALEGRRAFALATWEERRAEQVERAVADLEGRPSEALRTLEGMSEGCTRLAALWLDLAREASAGAFGPDRVAEACRLMGIGPDADDPNLDDFAAPLLALAGSAADGPGSPPARAELRDLFDAEATRCRDRARTLFVAVDAPRRERVAAAAMIDDSPEGQLRHRYEQSAERSLHRSLDALARARKEQARERPGSAPRTPMDVMQWFQAPNEPNAAAEEPPTETPAPNEANEPAAPAPNEPNPSGRRPYVTPPETLSDPRATPPAPNEANPSAPTAPRNPLTRVLARTA